MNNTIQIPAAYFAAMETLENGDWQHGSELMLEAARELLLILCEAQGCEQADYSRRAVSGLLKVYRELSRMDPGTFKAFGEIIAAANRGAGGRFIKPSYLSGCLELLGKLFLRCLEKAGGAAL